MKIKQTITTASVKEYTLDATRNLSYKPSSGDVGLFEIIEIDRHSSVQISDKRSAAIFEGDVIMAAFANRYATSQFEGYVPDTPQDLYHILGAGGAIGIVRTKNASLEHVEPTTVRLIGYCCDPDGSVINTRFRNQERVPFNATVPFGAKVILSIGSTMDSGKTTTAAHVARGLKTTNKTVAYIKFTGTAYTKDKDFVYDCGADVTADFSDLGFPSTYLSEIDELLDLYQSLLHYLRNEKPEFIVMEIADGLLQRETAFLLNNEAFMSTIHSVVFSCGDSLSAVQGVSHLRKIGIDPVLISGRFTMSPLLIQELNTQVDMPVLTIDEIMTGEYNHIILKENSVLVER